MNRSRLRLAAYVLGVMLLGFVVLQFVGPRVTNSPVVADLVAPDEVKAVLKTSCYNCHSNETHLWWYDKIAPASWLVARDVKRGRMHMNFSDFGQLSPAEQKAKLYESVNMMQFDSMPPKNYLFVHPEAKVTPEQIETLKKYLHPPDTSTAATPAPKTTPQQLVLFNPSDIIPDTPEPTTGPDTQYYSRAYADGVTNPATKVEPAPNGLAFFPDYASWKPVSFTDRFDNGTMRIILGNDVAQKAIAAGNVHPWPDGAAFAKIAYKQQPDAQGNIWTGEFLQVEFMIKDAQKYKSTEGWGFGRWKTTELKPYGKNANFTTECTSCHAPMQANDFVYTMPIRSDHSGDPASGDAFNSAAAFPPLLPMGESDPKNPSSYYNVLPWDVITTFYDPKHKTISALYGNETAFMHVRTSPQTAYPRGAVLGLVTWNEQEDKHWFGGRIPGSPKSVEIVKPGDYGYEPWQGSPLQEVDLRDFGTPEFEKKLWGRMDFIGNLKPAVMP
jgi:hypothetical protein